MKCCEVIKLDQTQALAKIILGICLAIGIPVADIYGQALNGTTAAGLAPGSPVGSYPLSGFETINPYSGNLNFSLPLMRVAGGGGDWSELLDLNAGTYTLSEANHSNWVCQITVH